MKKTLAITLSLLFILLCFASCKEEVAIMDDTPDGVKLEAKGVWASATYLENKTFGTGAKTVQVQVQAEDQSLTFTVKTDKEILGEALIEHNLISGDQGQYGLYVKVVNGITADYDVDQSYWALYKGGEYCMTGVDTTPIADGEHYELVYTK